MTENDMISLYEAHTELLDLPNNKNDCFTIEEAANTLDYSFIYKDLRKQEPQKFKDFLYCVCDKVKTLIQPYLETKSTSAGFGVDRSLRAMIPNFPSGKNLEGIHKRIKQIYLFVAYIEDKYKKDRDASGSNYTNLVSATLKYPFDSEEFKDEYSLTPVHDDQDLVSATLRFSVGNVSAARVKHPNKSEARVKHPKNSEAHVKHPKKLEARVLYPKKPEANVKHPKKSEAHVKHPKKSEARVKHTNKSEARVQYPKKSEVHVKHPKKSEARVKHTNKSEARVKHPGPDKTRMMTRGMTHNNGKMIRNIANRLKTKC